MLIILKTPTNTKGILPTPFGSEKELESLLMSHPELLSGDDGPPWELVGQQVRLGDAGISDLIFVDRDGLLIVVEVKLAANAQSRREVIAQAIDYISSLTELTVDELNELVQGQLEKVLKKLVGEDPVELDKTWSNVARNLRDGRAKIVVALDEVAPPLERIFRFLARTSDLDVQLLTVTRYKSEDAEVYVPRLVVTPESESRPGQSGPATVKTLAERLLACTNPAAVKFFEERKGHPMSKRQDSLKYYQAGKIHWYIWATPTGARAQQIDRFPGDEELWRSGLQNPDFSYLKRGDLLFTLATDSDFQFFSKQVEQNGDPKPWPK